MSTLADYLRKNGIRQTDFADEIGVGQAMVSRLVRGAARPSLPLALKIERASKKAVPVGVWDHPHPSVPTPAPKQEGAKG